MESYKLVKGEVYFSVAFVGRTRIPIITSWEFVRKANIEAPSKEERYIFKLHPHYRDFTESGIQLSPQKEEFSMPARDLNSLYTLSELISRLQELKASSE